MYKALGDTCNLTDAVKSICNYAKNNSRKTYCFTFFKAEGTLYQAEKENAYDIINEIHDKNLPIDICAICSTTAAKYGYAIDMCDKTGGFFKANG